jgi:hypothetical protein
MCMQPCECLAQPKFSSFTYNYVAHFNRFVVMCSPRHSYIAMVVFCITVYWLNLLPYLGVKRSTFVYHVSDWSSELLL